MMRQRVAFLLAVLMVVSLTAIAPAAGAETDRLAGADRFDTAVQIAERSFPDGAQVAYLAGGDRFADALAAGTLTDGPVLLVPSCGSIPATVAGAIDRLDPERVIALGGTVAVCDQVLEDAAVGRSADRLAGASRYETAAAIAVRGFPTTSQTVFLARGDDSPDAVAGGALTTGPILLVPPGGSVDVALAQVERLDPDVVIALGGTAAVSDEQLDAVAGSRDSRRVAGDTRFETAVAIAELAFTTDSSSDRPIPSVYLARGDVFADAVAAGSLTDGPILLVPGCTEIPSAVTDYIQAADPDTITALGGVNAVCEETLAAAAEGTTMEPDPEPTTVPTTDPTLDPTPDPSPEPTPDPTTDPEPGDGWVSYAEIEATGEATFEYPSVDHYVAQFLRSNPDARYWEVDEDGQRVRAVAVPEPSADAIELPDPSGGDDTDAVAAVVNASPNGEFVGTGTYRIAGLELTQPGTRIWNMPMVPPGNPGTFVNVRADDVRVYNSPIDAEFERAAADGWYVDGEDFHLIDSGYINMQSDVQDVSAAGVHVRNAGGYHLAGNDFDHMLNLAGPSETHRANPFWIHGNRTKASRGGYIVNNTASRSQSNGTLVDADFLTVQGYIGHDGLIRVFGNVTVDAGKRSIKAQTGGILALSNQFEWRDVDGLIPAAGSYTRLHMVSVQTGFTDQLTFQNNRVLVSGNDNWVNLFNISYQNEQDNWSDIHIDHNVVQVDSLTPPDQNFDRNLLYMSSCDDQLPENDSSREPADSSFSDNLITGEGSVRYFYVFGNGFDRDSGDFDTSGNTFEIEATRGTDLPRESQSSTCD